MKPNRKWDPLRPVRVRRDPPTLEEAVIAAQGLSADIEQQVEIASGLMGIPREEVRPVIASAPAPETARGFERSSRAMPQVVVVRRRTTPGRSGLGSSENLGQNFTWDNFGIAFDENSAASVMPERVGPHHGLSAGVDLNIRPTYRACGLSDRLAR